MCVCALKTKPVFSLIKIFSLHVALRWIAMNGTFCTIHLIGDGSNDFLRLYHYTRRHKVFSFLHKISYWVYSNLSPLHATELAKINTVNIYDNTSRRETNRIVLQTAKFAKQVTQP